MQVLPDLRQRSLALLSPRDYQADLGLARRLTYNRETEESFENFFFMNGQVHAIVNWGLGRLGIM
jgi:hypothetical protein